MKVVSGVKVLRVRTGNITKTNFIEKGISTMLLSYKYRKAIDIFFKNMVFDLVLYSTPPITLVSVVKYLKRKGAFSYLMLKDIFPQNAVDLGIINKKGLTGILYYYFRRIELKLYSYSDKIGCMSPANVEYILKHNKGIKKEKLEICPNTIDDIPIIKIDKGTIRKEYGLPENKIIFIYGGNFGKPQGVEYILQVLEEALILNRAYFVLCGSGTEFHKIKEYKELTGAENLTVIESLPYSEYENLLRASDVALIFLDYRFTIPNFPSRLLDYMNVGLPVLAATDMNTDIGKLIVEHDFGWWCESKDVKEYINLVADIISHCFELQYKGMNGKKYLSNHFATQIAYKKIVHAYDLWEIET